MVVFSFVALWHDLSLKLLTWGWVISLFVLPEMGARKFVPYEKVRLSPPLLFLAKADGVQYGRRAWYRHLAAVGGVLNILMMMTANLIGFAIGTEGMSYMWGKMIGSWEGSSLSLCLCGRELMKSRDQIYDRCGSVLVRRGADHVRVSVSRGRRARWVEADGVCREEERRRGIVRRC